jgi:hypothetical protein
VATNAFAQVTTNLIAAPIDITFQDGYGVLGFADGKFQITASYDFTTLDALDYATAESNPDGMLRTLADHGELVLAGEKTTEFWGNTGAQDFPYGNQRGSTLEFGLVAPWSLVKYNDSLVGLFKNIMGQCQVMVMAGHALRKISSQEMDSNINGYSAVADATGFSYMLGGHPMYQLNFPTAGKSWLYDASTDLWSPLEYGLSGERHRGEIMFDYLGEQRVTDYATGRCLHAGPRGVHRQRRTHCARDRRQALLQQLRPHGDPQPAGGLRDRRRAGQRAGLGPAGHAAGVQGQRPDVGRGAVGLHRCGGLLPHPRHLAAAGNRSRLGLQDPHHRPGEGGHHQCSR